MKWKQVNISDVALIVRESIKPFIGERPFLATGDIDISVVNDTESVTYNNRPSRADLNVQMGDVIIARMAATNKVKVIEPHEEKLIVSTGFLVLRPSDKINTRFLYHCMLSKNFQKEKDKQCTGATQKAINNEKFEKLQIPLPPIDNQVHIASILDHADKLRQLNKQLLNKYDDLAQSVFLEMFGDPVRNEKGWGKSTIRKLCSKITDGPFGSNLKTEHYSNEGVRVIRLQNIGIGVFNNEDISFIKEDHYNNVLKKYTCYPGDVLIATMGAPNIRACILPDFIKTAINKADCILCRLNSSLIDKNYFCYLINNPAFLSIAGTLFHGQTRTRISMGQIANIEIPVPTIEDQIQFSKIATIIENQKKTINATIQDSETLFQTLMQRAFNGDLIN